MVRTRIAPSPTGSPHVGTLYMGLFNRAFARKHGGQFLLRIEDTDQTRSRRIYETQILESLRWAGLEWDEGPDVGGPHAPYRQSERSDLYREHAEILLRSGQAYRCFCTAADLDAMRAEQKKFKQPSRYDQRCRRLSAQEAEGRLADGLPFTVRLKVPNEGKVVVDDRLRGKVEFELSLIDDQVLMKSDGLPTYHLANVVDDRAMGITHVIRGEEWLNSAPKHVLLYQAFGWPVPEWYHMPLLLNPDGTKLSKRRNPTSITYYREAGFLPEALSNYLCQMSYSRPGGEEKYDFAAFVSDFELGRVSLGGSVFDRTKLLDLNGRYVREDLSEAELLRRLVEWRFNPEFLARVLPLMKSRMETLGDLFPVVHFLYARNVPLAEADLVPKGRTLAEVPPVAQTMIWALDEGEEWTVPGVEAALLKVAGFWDWKIRDVTRIGFAALMGRTVGPPLYESIHLLGRDLVRDRLLAAMDFAGGLSKKQTAALQERWKVPEAGGEGG